MSERKATPEEIEDLKRRFPPKDVTAEVVALAKRASDAEERFNRLLALITESLDNLETIPVISKSDIVQYLRACLDTLQDP